jgi:outer membrane protein assembly factor BamB
MPSRRAMLAALGAAGAAGAVGAARVAGVRRPVDVTGEWYRGSYDSGRTAYGRERDGPGPGLTRRWSTRIPDGVHSPAPVLVDGGVHVVAAPSISRQNDAGAPVSLLRVDPASGRIERETVVTRYDGPDTIGALVWDSLVYADGTFYVLAFDGVHALAPDGSEHWHRSLGGAPSNSILGTGHPVVDGETVYVPTASTTDHTDATEGLYALDSRSGDVRWRYEAPEGRGWTFAPAYADGTVYCALLDYGVVALNAASGDIEWETRLPVTGPPTMAEGRVYVSLETSGAPERAHVAALAAGTGEEAWRSEGDGTWLGRSVAAAEGRVFHREALSDLVCRDAATGETRWRHDLAVAGLGTPALVDGRVYALARPAEGGDTGLLALDAATGEQVGFAATRYGSGSDASVAISDGLAFASTSTGTVEAFETCLAGVDGHCLH